MYNIVCKFAFNSNTFRNTYKNFTIARRKFTLNQYYTLTKHWKGCEKGFWIANDAFLHSYTTFIHYISTFWQETLRRHSGQQFESFFNSGSVERERFYIQSENVQKTPSEKYLLWISVFRNFTCLCTCYLPDMRRSMSKCTLQMYQMARNPFLYVTLTMHFAQVYDFDFHLGSFLYYHYTRFIK